MAVAIAVLVVLMLAALIGLTRLDLGDDASAGHKKRPAHLAPTSSSTRSTTTTTTPHAIEYRVQPGDTLTSIARRFGVSTGIIVLTNRLANPDRLTVGQTLTIPPVSPVRFVITPASVAPGETVRLVLTGATPSEKVTFRIDSPGGSFTGPAHQASDRGRVAATYTPAPDAPTGTYTVIARGDQGTTAQTSLIVHVPNG